MNTVTKNTAEHYPIRYEKTIKDESFVSGSIKTCPEDFVVDEVLGFEPSGQGEHLFIRVSKTGLNTESLVSDIAKIVNLKKRDIGYSGLKDKHAVTSQWLSFPWPIKQPLPEWRTSDYSWEVIEMRRHDRKLKRGVHQGNEFRVVIRNITNIVAFNTRLENIREKGFPNYFGEQRFGFHGSNLEKVTKLFRGELKCRPAIRSLLYSAARSYLFNEYLSYRVSTNTWDKVLEGDIYKLEGSGSLFGPDDDAEALAGRLAYHDIHPAGLLFGIGNSRYTSTVAEQVAAIENRYPDLINGLRQANIKTAYRPLRAVPKTLNWEIDNDACTLSFFLPSGSYATALIEQLLDQNEK